MNVVEASIADLRASLESGRTTCVELVTEYLRRIAAHDRAGARLNSIPVLNPAVFQEAHESDQRRQRGETLGPLDGIPFTAKDSYAVAGLPCAAGSPAFAHLVPRRDSYAVERLRAGGAVLVGLTTMPPMANGGMQRGLYGRAESPYNGAYLTSAFGSGSSNGSGTATAASFAAFGLGEETWSSGRAPASCNALVAYCPSRGVISTRGNWPLVPTMDVVVPHTRSVSDLLEVLDVLVADDTDHRGDFWRQQPWLPIASVSEVRPASYVGLTGSLAGVRFGVPRLYINDDTVSTHPVETRTSVMQLWKELADDLRRAGAEIVPVDFPAVQNYEKDRPGAQSMVDRGFVPEGFDARELWDLAIWGWEQFLAYADDPALRHVADVVPERIEPRAPGALPDQYSLHHLDLEVDLAEYPARAQAGVPELAEIPLLADGVRGLDHTRSVDFDQWLDSLGLDAIIHPTLADVAPADSDVNPASAAIAWRNGTWVANGNLVPRHLGIPSVTVPMGTMNDIGMPVGLTISGRGGDDVRLLGLGRAVEASRWRRTIPHRTRQLRALSWTEVPAGDAGADGASDVEEGTPGAPGVSLHVDEHDNGDASCTVTLGVELVNAPGDVVTSAVVLVDGRAVPLDVSEGRVTASGDLASPDARTLHSPWRGPYGSLVVAMVRTRAGRTLGGWTAVCGIA